MMFPSSRYTILVQPSDLQPAAIPWAPRASTRVDRLAARDCLGAHMLERAVQAQMRQLYMVAGRIYLLWITDFDA